MNIKSEIKKGDIILIVSILLLSAAFFIVPALGSESLEVKIYHQGEVVHRAVLSDVAEEYTIQAAGCRIAISSSGAVFEESLCSDGLCVKAGMLTKKGDSMACVPQKVAVVIDSAEEAGYDGIAY